MDEAEGTSVPVQTLADWAAARDRQYARFTEQQTEKQTRMQCVQIAIALRSPEGAEVEDVISDARKLYAWIAGDL